jgi:hypothetical protein
VFAIPMGIFIVKGFGKSVTSLYKSGSFGSAMNVIMGVVTILDASGFNHVNHSEVWRDCGVVAWLSKGVVMPSSSVRLNNTVS